MKIKNKKAIGDIYLQDITITVKGSDQKFTFNYMCELKSFILLNIKNKEKT